MQKNANHTPKTHIQIKGARVNNLKNIDVDIPKNQLVVITGMSGSGKSSLAFDTLYAEGQRRYVESLSSYARQFMGRMNKPDVDYIKGIAPAIAIEQKVISSNPRSTVGTSTEIYDYLKLLFARIGKTYSPVSGKVVTKDTVSSIVDRLLAYDDDDISFGEDIRSADRIRKIINNANDNCYIIIKTNSRNFNFHSKFHSN